MKTLLYIHGMGGGEDSRIPSILRERLSASGIDVIVHTYDFDPSVASAQTAAWFEKYSPDLVVGESLGFCHAMRLRGVPHIFVSPAVNAPEAFLLFSRFARLKPIRKFYEWRYKPSRPLRQQISFEPELLSRYDAFQFAKVADMDDYVYAFFGNKDAYRRTGIVSVRHWERIYGKSSYTIYNGTHFMEEEYIDSLLVPEILAHI